MQGKFISGRWSICLTENVYVPQSKILLDIFTMADPARDYGDIPHSYIWLKAPIPP